MDELVKYCTKFAKALDSEESLDTFMKVAKNVDVLITEAMPLVDQVYQMSQEVRNNYNCNNNNKYVIAIIIIIYYLLFIIVAHDLFSFSSPSSSSS